MVVSALSLVLDKVTEQHVWEYFNIMSLNSDQQRRWGFFYCKMFVWKILSIQNNCREVDNDAGGVWCKNLQLESIKITKLTTASVPWEGLTNYKLFTATREGESFMLKRQNLGWSITLQLSTVPVESAWIKLHIVKRMNDYRYIHNQDACIDPKWQSIIPTNNCLFSSSALWINQIASVLKLPLHAYWKHWQYWHWRGCGLKMTERGQSCYISNSPLLLLKQHKNTDTSCIYVLLTSLEQMGCFI